MKRNKLFKIILEWPPIDIFVDKVPFLAYFSRLISFLFDAKITENKLSENKLRFALIDLFLSFAFVLAVIAVYAFISGNYLLLKIVGSFDPIPWVGTFLLYGLTFSLVLSLLEPISKVGQ